MRLLSLKLEGIYKGLQNQYFDFQQTQGNIIALIGLNGSGKSQLLELIGEVFAFLERYQRDDFIVRTSLGFGIEVHFQCSVENDPYLLNYPDASVSEDGIPVFKVRLALNGNVYLSVNQQTELPVQAGQRSFPLPNVIGYSSGLNENLQRSFMKNSVQYFDVMRIRLRRKKELAANLNDEQISDINHRFWSKYPHIFSPESGYYADDILRIESGEYLVTEGGEPITVENLLLGLREYPSSVSRCVYLDYDSAGLALASLALLPRSEIDSFLNDITYKYPVRMVLHYDLRGDIAGTDAVRDIKLLARIAGEKNIVGLGSKTTDTQFEVFELDYLSGQITLDLTNNVVLEQLKDASYGDPAALFKRFYQLQQLGVKNWQGVVRQKLRKDNYLDTVKKPLKGKLPLSVVELQLSNKDGQIVKFDDLSDGEAQLIQVLAMAKLFSDRRTLFLLDEPETHLNPSWRTYFHSHLSKAIGPEKSGFQQSQVFLSTHSPFMVSSLKREDVMFFERSDGGLIKMEPVAGQTYGASFDVLIKNHFGLRSLISQTAVEAVKAYLPQDDQPESLAAARQWIEGNLGDSMEKAYLLRKLQS